MIEYCLQLATGTSVNLMKLENRATLIQMSLHRIAAVQIKLSSLGPKLKSTVRRSGNSTHLSLFCHLKMSTDLFDNVSWPLNTTAGPDVEGAPRSVKPQYNILYELLPIAVAIVVVNSIVFYLFAKSKRLRNPTNCLLLSLAVCDFMTGLICIPLLISVVVGIELPIPHFGYFNVVFNNSIAISASYHILAVTLERFVCIKWPFSHLQSTKKSMVKVALLVWFVAAVVGFMPYAWFSLTDNVAYRKIQVGYIAFCLAFVFLVPCILIVVSQIITFKAIAKSCGQGLTARKADQRKAKNDKKCLIIFGLMALIYVVCWLPWFVISLYFSFWFPLSQETIEMLLKLSQVVVIFRYVTSIVNPLLYTFFKKDFITAFKRIILRKKSLNRSSTTATTRILKGNSQKRRSIGSESSSNENIEVKELNTML